MESDVDLLYRQHLTPSDLRLIADATGSSGSGALGSVLSSPNLEAAVFADHGVDRGLIGPSPFLTFAVAVHRTAERLRSTSFVEERWTPRQRLPMFDVESLRQVLVEPHRYFLIELLASYTHVVSGSTWQRTRRGWRRRRFSELDLYKLAELLDSVEPAERTGVYRRLGDLTLFLTGVFPDHSSLLDVGPVTSSRLARLSQAHGAPAEGGLEGLELLEELGRRFYGLAVASARFHGAPSTPGLTIVALIAERFRDARRALNVVTDWYVFPLREHWFGAQA
jgi:hypothetical protein